MDISTRIAVMEKTRCKARVLSGRTGCPMYEVFDIALDILAMILDTDNAEEIAKYASMIRNNLDQIGPDEAIRRELWRS